MTKIADLETPCVVIDVRKVEANLARAQAHSVANGYALRPHIKTHKLPRFARRQVELGAVGITAQKLGEAEVMADAGLTDIFVPYNIVGDKKLARLAALNERITLSVTADSPDTRRGLCGDLRHARQAAHRPRSSATPAVGAAACSRRRRRSPWRGTSRHVAGPALRRADDLSAARQVRRGRHMARRCQGHDRASRGSPCRASPPATVPTCGTPATPSSPSAAPAPTSISTARRSMPASRPSPTAPSPSSPPWSPGPHPAGQSLIPARNLSPATPSD